MHNLTKLLRGFDENTLVIAQDLNDENAITILSKSGRGIKASVRDGEEDFIVFIEFADDLSVASTTCSCDTQNLKCYHTAAVLLYVKNNFLRAINKYKRENMKDQLLVLDYYKARDFLVRAISNQTIKKNQLKVVLLDNKKFTKDQRAALFSLCFANYLHIGINSCQFKNLMKPAIEIMDEYIDQNFFTVEELEQIIYDAVTLFDQNDFREFLSTNIRIEPFSTILQHVHARLANAKESCCILIKENEKGILKGEIPLAFETLLTAIQHYDYSKYVSFKVFCVGIENAIKQKNIRNFNVLFFLGFTKYPEMDKAITDELVLFIQENHEKIVPRLIKMLGRLDLDQINAFFIYLLNKMCDEEEAKNLRNTIITAVSSSKSVNSPLLYFAIREESKYEITVTNSNYRQICQMIDFARDDEKQYLTTLIVKRLENNFIECTHEFETNFEIELLLKSHQEYVQLFLENSLKQTVNKKRRLFYLSLARKYNLLTKVGLHVFEGN